MDVRRVLGLAGGAAAAVVLWQVRDLLVLLAFAVLVAYALDPLVGALERLPLPRRARLSRPAAAALLSVALVVAGVWLLALGLPRLAAEFGRFAERLPATLDGLLRQARAYAAAHGLEPYLAPVVENLRAQAPAAVQPAGAAVVRWLGRLFTGLGQLVGFALLPLLSFYLLAERERVGESLFRFVPPEWQARLAAAGGAVDRALRSYVRGLTLVCAITGATMGVLLSLLGFPLALLLAVLAGLAEIVPYVGFALAAAAIALTGYTVHPGLALAGVAGYAAVNAVVGFLVTPQVMGRHLTLHPFVVTVSILAGGKLMGPAGVLLALPATAACQALIAEFAPRPAGAPAEPREEARS